jgi:glycosyltransferase involved in cell wall biosynthesis
MSESRRLVWIGDAAVASGFAKCTHYILDYLKDHWKIYVLGLNYLGDPHNYDYPIYPCFSGGDAFGLGRVVELINKIKPDIVIVQNDPWNIPAYLNITGNVPVIASMPVDGKNCKGRGLNGLALAIFWTEFARNEANLGGYTGPSEIINLGVDLNIFEPRKKKECRRKVGLPDKLDEAFIIGNINRNQPRKRLDLTLEYFTEWIRKENINDAYLFFHVAPTGDAGYDLGQLGHYYGVANKLILADLNIGKGVLEEELVNVYNCFDVQVTTTQGEGWGLTTMEGMACGIPQIVPDWSALGEWCKDAAILIPCINHITTPTSINVVGGVPEKQNFIAQLNLLYKDKELRSTLIKKGLDLVIRDEYRWENIGRRFYEAIEKFMYPERIEKVG